MRAHVVRLSLLTSVLVAAARAAASDVCVAIDEATDSLAPPDRPAAILLVSRQFEQAGERIVAAPCSSQYSLSHARLGNIIAVAISGPAGRREGIAAGTDDLPALYSQMVRSLVTGRPMAGLNVVDRTNVTISQASARRIHSDSLWYARLGFGGVFGDRAYGTPALGFGYRAELDSLAIDVSFLNFQFGPPNDYYSGGGNVSANSLLKLSGLYFLDAAANRTSYVGAGLSYGHTSFGGGNYRAVDRYSTEWDGSGLQAELTYGYELARATSLRMFLQADAVLPFYQVSSETISRTGLAITTDRRYAPSLVVSIGVGR
jgi:hypothetical protein